MNGKDADYVRSTHEGSTQGRQEGVPDGRAPGKMEESMIFMGDDFSRTTDEGKLSGYTPDQEEVLDQMNEELTGKQIDLMGETLGESAIMARRRRKHENALCL